jgi:hypothetical protein
MKGSKMTSKSKMGAMPAAITQYFPQKLRVGDLHKTYDSSEITHKYLRVRYLAKNDCER